MKSLKRAKPLVGPGMKRFLDGFFAPITLPIMILAILPIMVTQEFGLNQTAGMIAQGLWCMFLMGLLYWSEL